MQKQNNKEDFQMNDIDKHLKAEAKIREVHSIIDDLLASDVKEVEEVKEGTFFNWKNLGIILVVLLTGLGIWIWSTNKQADNPKKSPQIEDKFAPPIAQNNIKTSTPNQNLIAAHFSPVEWKSRNTRSLSSNAPEEQKLLAKEKYLKKDYKEALKVIEPLTDKYPNDWELLFHQTLCQMNTTNQNTGTIIQSLNQIIDNDYNDYIEDADWFLVAAYLQKNETEKAKSILSDKILNDPTHKYFKKVNEVLEDLEK